MRLFVALPVTGAAEEELERKLAEYRREAWPVAWVRDGGLHVTIKFLSEVEERRVTDISAALGGAAAGTSVLQFVPTEISAFPSFTRARVLWAGYESESALELMVHRIEQALVPLGFPGEGHPFRPHVTLGRLRDGARLGTEARRRLERETLSGGFSADRLVLYQSRTGPGGSVYSEVDSFSLSA
jgi:RNA 2',3'-cyclic 3'-phosphodiesterase